MHQNQSPVLFASMKLTRGESAAVAAGGAILATFGLVTGLWVAVILGAGVLVYAGLTAWVASGRRIV